MHPDEDYAYETQRQRRLDEEFEMDIDYAAIIEKANTRKERLQGLAERLKRQPEMLSKLQEVQQWATEVRNWHNALDDEGRTLLPLRVRGSLASSTTTIVRIGQVIDADDVGIRWWSE
jgi:hypothetical protein